MNTHIDYIRSIIPGCFTLVLLSVCGGVSHAGEPSDSIVGVSPEIATQEAQADSISPLIIENEPATSIIDTNTPEEIAQEESYDPPEAPKLGVDAPYSSRDTIAIIEGRPRSIYSQPLSWTGSDPWWHGMWINTSVVTGAYIATLFVLECLPEDATAWNRADITGVPFYKRWFRNIFKKGPEWDHDKFMFNWVLHPYAGAAYFMCARTCGFNFWQSMLYSALISTVGWEFGIEACMERPSYQDLFVTPLVGSVIGEGFYRLKRLIVDRNYEILGSPYIGHILAFFLDPVNEVIGWLSPGTCRTIGPGCLQSQPLLIPNPAPGYSPSLGISFSATF